MTAPRAEQRILIVDDSDLQLHYAAALLQELGFRQLLLAHNGEEALRLLEKIPPVDLLITDLDMPEMDGVELIEAATQHGSCQQIIAMSARDPRLLAAIEAMAQSGAYPLLGTLEKPLTQARLEALLNRLVAIPSPLPAAPDLRPAYSLADIQAGLAAEQFVPYYQPKIDIRHGEVKGVEALARWLHPEHGVISPAFFIPQLENQPLIDTFTEYLLHKVTHDLKQWLKAELTISVSANLSAARLGQKGLLEFLDGLCLAQEVPTDRLVFEVTETMLMGHLTSSIGTLTRMRLKGFGLAMDDYGIGYSSIQQLSRCPFTELKIDREFVHGAASQISKRIILESSIQMGRRLGVLTVAEGVETHEDWLLLAELGCDMAQGYYIAKPMPAQELTGWLQHYRPRR